MQPARLLKNANNLQCGRPKYILNESPKGMRRGTLLATTRQELTAFKRLRIYRTESKYATQDAA